MGESFFQRWSRRKAEQTVEDAADGDGVPAGTDRAFAPGVGDAAHGSTEGPLPTLDDVARLTPDSDYSLFVSKRVDRSVRRAAMKKLFADPHFNAMDGLDIYIGDYTKPSPLTPAMLASLKHTQSMFEAFAKTEQERKEREDALAAESMHAGDAAALSEGGAKVEARPAHAASPDESIAEQTADANAFPGADEGMPRQDRTDNSIRQGG